MNNWHRHAQRAHFRLLLVGFICLLSGCGGSTGTNQTTLTNAQMVSPAASCNEIVHNIQALDRIILQGNTGAGNNYGHMATQGVNTGLAVSGVLRKVPGIGGLTNTVAGLGQGQGNQMKYQQSYQAQAEKQRLITLFQQKQCVRVP